ncbi:hypothetical protein XELAEV_18035484mg [Xenopus laevis]|uniref:ZP domain-containing protein n=1 Tax=Xenopus laevis TaxID=8355 RepID=A0A974CFV9_XENLA|nr:hypothetical protein XELAEV_18035484mg [Xenopus laevis]
MGLRLLLLLVFSAQRCIGQTIGQNCSDAYNRLPDNSDIATVCGTQEIQLSIKACPVWYAQFEPQSLALSGKGNISKCLGTLDTSTETPVIIEQPGSDNFGAYSLVQTVVISGFVDSISDTASGVVTYTTNIHYNFSCYYPLLYLVNNTQLLTSFGAVAVNSNNGSFISTLSMKFFLDEGLMSPMQLNGTVYKLNQKIFVEVFLNNTSTSFNVLLDQCFATPSPLLTSTLPDERHNFFTGCNVTSRTNVTANGLGKSAKFNFDSFRFLQHQGQKSSSIYVHCITILCKPETCQKYLSSCTKTRRKRDATLSDSATQPVTVSSGPFEIGGSTEDNLLEVIPELNQFSDSMTGIIIGIVIAVVIAACLVCCSRMLCKMYHLKAPQAK